VNQEAVFKAGDLVVVTQQYDASSGQHYGIATGRKASNFQTVKGGVSVPVGKELKSVGTSKHPAVMSSDGKTEITPAYTSTYERYMTYQTD